MKYFQCFCVLAVLVRLSEQVAIENRIVNGIKVNIKHFPYQAFISQIVSRNKTSVKSSNCGGSIISKKNILTAAHCVTIGSDYGWSPSNPEDIKVMVGKSSTKKFLQQMIFLKGVNKFIVHPDYTYYKKINEFTGKKHLIIKNDIALIELLKPLEWSPTISRVRLPSLKETDASSYSGKTAVATGWGLMYGNKITYELHAAHLAIPEDKENHIKDVIIVPTKDDKRAICEGDSGGPLVIRSRDPKTAVQYGISSTIKHFNPDDAQCHKIESMEFVDVVYFRKWIFEMTNIGDDDEDNDNLSEVSRTG